MKKRFLKLISAMTALSVIAIGSRVTGTSAYAEDWESVDLSGSISLSDLPDRSELEQMYIERLFYGNGISLQSDYGRQALTGTQLYVYNTLRAEIEKIAAGTRTNTEISVTLDKGVPNDLLEAVTIAYEYLRVDMPEEFYWCDATRFSAGAGSYQGLYTNFYANFPVSMDYSADGSFGTYETNPDKIKAAQASVINAQKIAEKYSGLSDYEKVAAYKEEICSLTSYNWDAATSDLNIKPPYGDPWQIIWVFDGDPNTNVVCEGYAKAFQYLCDLGGVECYTITGYMGTLPLEENAHMWNIVMLDGKPYHVDITNCDDDSIGAPDYLFLKGAETSSAEGCYFKFDNGEVPYIYSTFSDEVDVIYPPEILTVSTEDYISSESEPTAGDVNGDGKITAADLIFVRRYISHLSSDISPAADLNGDGKITAADLILLRRMYAEN